MGLVLMGGAVLSKSLIQFSVNGWSCVAFLLFTWGRTMVEVMIMETSFKRSHAQSAPLSAPTPQQATSHACLCRILLDTPGQVWVSLLWGHCSFLLGPGVLNVPSVPSQSLLPQSCVSSGSSMVCQWRPPPRGLLPYPGLLHPEPLPLWQATADPYGLTQSLWSLLV